METMEALHLMLGSLAREDGVFGRVTRADARPVEEHVYDLVLEAQEESWSLAVVGSQGPTSSSEVGKALRVFSWSEGSSSSKTPREGCRLRRKSLSVSSDAIEPHVLAVSSSTEVPGHGKRLPPAPDAQVGRVITDLLLLALGLVGDLDDLRFRWQERWDRAPGGRRWSSLATVERPWTAQGRPSFGVLD